MQQLLSVNDTLWMWAVPSVWVVTAIVLTGILRAPQILLLRDGFRSALVHDPRAPGTMPPGTAVLLGAAMTHGSAAAVSAATAVSLGGAGALAWLWLFGLLIAPLRYAETWLARTAPPGQPGAIARGSLASRFIHDSSRIVRGTGIALAVLVPLAGFAYVGGVHGEAAMDAAERLLPGSAQSIGVGVAAIAAILVLPALAKPAPAASVMLGWLALGAVLTVFGVALIAISFDMSRGVGALFVSIEDAFSGAPNVGSFSGALAGEIAGVAMLHGLLPLASSLGVDGALHAAARAPLARGQAAASMLGPFLHVILATTLGLSFIATGAFHRRVEDVRRLDEVTFWESGFETVSQRREAERAFTGTLRVLDGEARARPLELGTERGMITAPRFIHADGSPGDFAIRVDHSRITAYLVPEENGTLTQVPLSRISEIRVEGRMLPRAGTLLAASMVRAGGEAASRIVLTALLFLAAIGAAGWGVAISRSMPEQIGRIVAFVPALGLLLAATGSAPWLGPIGRLMAGVLAIVAMLGILMKTRELLVFASSKTIQSRVERDPV